MTRKDRVISSLNHKEPDIIPYHADFTLQEMDNMIRYTGNCNFMKDYHLHLHYNQYWGWPTELSDKKEFFKDSFGVVWNRSGVDKDIGVIDIPVISDADISLKPVPSLDEQRLRREYEKILSEKEDRFCFTGIGFSMFERLWSYCGMENALIFMLEEPEFTHALLDEICEFNCKVIDIANEYPFDGFYFGDDWGQQKGLIMGARLWREFIKPRMRIMYEHAHKNGKYIMQHSCGDIYELFPDLIEIGLDCYQTFQPEIYDIEKVKKEYGNYLTFWGGISTQQLLTKASCEYVKKETIRIMKLMSKGGGYIAAPTHALPSDIPPENVLAMLDVFENQGKYF